MMMVSEVHKSLVDTVVGFEHQVIRARASLGICILCINLNFGLMHNEYGH